MKLTQFLLDELDRETPLTRRLLEQAPEGLFEWKPHEKCSPGASSYPSSAGTSPSRKGSSITWRITAASSPCISPAERRAVPPVYGPTADEPLPGPN